jgi:hypothetical protein
MSAGIGQKIEILDYTGIRDKLNTICGTDGYGSTLLSSDLNSNEVITVAKWSKLRKDLINISNHQNSSIIADSANMGSTNLQKPTVDDTITDGFRIQYDTFVNNLLLNRYTVNPSELKNTILVEATRTTNWNDVITQVITISGHDTINQSGQIVTPAAKNLEYFFNSGGSIQLTSSISNFSLDTTYNPGDIVRYRGHYYKVTQSTIGNLPEHSPYFIGQIVYQFSLSAEYNPGDIVVYQNKYYITKVKSAGNLVPDTTYFNKYSVFNFDFIETYQVGTIVQYDNQLFKVIKTTTEIPTSNTEYFSPCTIPDFNLNQTYTTDTIVKNGTSYYITTQTTVNNPVPDFTYFDTFSVIPYGSTETYYPGDIIKYDSYYYKVTELTTIPLFSNPEYFTVFNVKPFNLYQTFLLDDVVDDQGKYFKTIKVSIGNPTVDSVYFTPQVVHIYNPKDSYKVGDLVLHNNIFYIVKKSITAAVPPDHNYFFDYYPTTIPAYKKGTNSPKNTSWTDLLDSIGTISLNYTEITHTGNRGSCFNIGFYDLTADEDQILFLAKNNTGTYAENYYKLIGRLSSDKSKIILTAYYADSSSEYPVDLNVSGELTSIVAEVRSNNIIKSNQLSATQAGLDMGLPGLVYSIIPNILEATEGDTVVFSIITNDIPPNNNQLYWTITGTATPVDFADGQIFGSLHITSTGEYSLFRQIKVDDLTESSKYFKVQIRTGSITGPIVKTSNKVSIRDILTYSINTVTVEVNEGDTVIFNITTNAPDNTPIYWKTIGSTITIDDFEDGILSGTVVAQRGLAKLSRKIKADAKTDGEKRFRVSIYTDPTKAAVDTSDEVKINDTSKDVPVLKISPSSLDIAEGDTVTFQITGGSPSQKVYWTTSGDTTPADFRDAVNSGSIVLDSSGKGTLSRTLILDALLDGVKFFAIQLRPKSSIGAIAVTSANIRVANKTVASLAIEPNITTINEGGSVLFNVTGNLPAGSLIFWSIISSTVTGADFTDDKSEGVVAMLPSGSVVISRTLRADRLTEGVESFTMAVGLTAGDKLKESASVAIEDTSTTYYSYMVTVDSTVLEGSQVVFTVNSDDTTLPTLYWTITGTIEANDFVGGKLNGTVNLDASGKGTISKTLIQVVNQIDITKSFTLQLRKDSVVGSTLTSSQRVFVKSNAAVVASPDVPFITEGETVTFNVTSNLPQNTTLYWEVDYTKSGIGQNDIKGGTDAGILILTNGAGKIPITIIDNIKTDDVKSLVIVLKQNSHSGDIVAYSDSVDVYDTPRSSFTYVITPCTEGGIESYTYNEGDTILFKISSPNDKTGNTVLRWDLVNLVGIIKEDFVIDTTLTNEFKLDKTGNTTISAVLAKDTTNEGAETFKVQITNTFTNKVVATSYQITVRDVSRNPETYTITVDGTVTEGQELNGTLKVDNGSAGFQYDWYIIHGVTDPTTLQPINLTNSQDFKEVSGKTTALDDTGTCGFTISVLKNTDTVTSSKEQFRVGIKKNDVLIKTSDPITILESTGTSDSTGTTTEQITYTLVADKSSYNEGDYITLKLTADPATSGTFVLLQTSLDQNLNKLTIIPAKISISMSAGVASTQVQSSFGQNDNIKSIKLSFLAFKESDVNTVIATSNEITLQNIDKPGIVYDLAPVLGNFTYIFEGSSDYTVTLSTTPPSTSDTDQYKIRIRPELLNSPPASSHTSIPFYSTTTPEYKSLNAHGTLSASIVIKYDSFYHGNDTNIIFQAVRKSDGVVVRESTPVKVVRGENDHYLDPTISFVDLSKAPAMTVSQNSQSYEFSSGGINSFDMSGDAIDVYDYTYTKNGTNGILPSVSWMFGTIDKTVSANIISIIVIIYSGNVQQYYSDIKVWTHDYPEYVGIFIDVFFKKNIQDFKKTSFKILVKFDSGAQCISNLCTIIPGSKDTTKFTILADPVVKYYSKSGTNSASISVLFQSADNASSGLLKQNKIIYTATGPSGQHYLSEHAEELRMSSTTFATQFDRPYFFADHWIQPRPGIDNDDPKAGTYTLNIEQKHDDGTTTVLVSTKAVLSPPWDTTTVSPTTTTNKTLPNSTLIDNIYTSYANGILSIWLTLSEAAKLLPVVKDAWTHIFIYNESSYQYFDLIKDQTIEGVLKITTAEYVPDSNKPFSTDVIITGPFIVVVLLETPHDYEYVFGSQKGEKFGNPIGKTKVNPVTTTPVTTPTPTTTTTTPTNGFNGSTWGNAGVTVPTTTTTAPPPTPPVIPTPTSDSTISIQAPLYAILGEHISIDIYNAHRWTITPIMRGGETGTLLYSDKYTTKTTIDLSANFDYATICAFDENDELRPIHVIQTAAGMMTFTDTDGHPINQSNLTTNDTVLAGLKFEAIDDPSALANRTVTMEVSSAQIGTQSYPLTFGTLYDRAVYFERFPLTFVPAGTYSVNVNIAGLDFVWTDSFTVNKV